MDNDTHRHVHVIIFHKRAIEAGGRDQEYDDSRRDAERRQGEEPRGQEVVVLIVRRLHRDAHRQYYDTRNLKHTDHMNIFYALL